MIAVPNAKVTLKPASRPFAMSARIRLERRRPQAGHRDGRIEGPRIIPAGYSFGATGGHCDSTGLPPSFDAHSPYNVDSPDEGRKRVREVRKYGAEVIKICATGGVFSHNTEPGQQQLTLAEMKAIVEEAKMWGLRVAAHAHGAIGHPRCGLAGVDHDRTRQPDRRRRHRGWPKEDGHLPVDGHLQHRLHPVRRAQERRDGRQSAQGPRSRAKSSARASSARCRPA
jgi:hypothetical protein